MLRKIAPPVLFPTLRNLTRRHLHLLEYQSFQLLRKHGVPTPDFHLAKSPAEARNAATRLADVHQTTSYPRKYANNNSRTTSSLSPARFVVKAQVEAGGRGKGYIKESGFRGGVKLCHDVSEVEFVSRELLGKTLVTPQTGDNGKLIESVIVTSCIPIMSERYLSLIMDNEEGPCLLGSQSGGMDIENKDRKDALFKVPLNQINKENTPQVCSLLNLPWHSEQLLCKLKEIFLKFDCLLLEINPLVITEKHQVMVCDTKMTIDDNAAFRHKNLFQKQKSSNFVSLNKGDIGCIVNGAGLALATMDLLKLLGGEPANFLDLGGGTGADEIKEAVAKLNDDPKIHSIFVNIFGGILRCDTVIKALIETPLKKRVFARLAGAGKREAEALIKIQQQLLPSSSSIEVVDEVWEAAKKAVTNKKQH